MGFSRQEHWSGLPLPSPNMYLHMAIYPDHSLMFKNAYNLQTLVHKLYMLLLLLSHFSCFNSEQPHRGQPTRLLCPWDSPGKNTGVGCHFLLQCIKVKSKTEVVQSCLTLSDPMDCSPPGSSVHGISRQEYWSGVPLPSPNNV